MNLDQLHVTSSVFFFLARKDWNRRCSGSWSQTAKRAKDDSEDHVPTTVEQQEAFSN